MTRIRLTLDIPPSGNRYWRHSKNGKPYLSQDAKDYRALVGWTARQLGAEPLSGPVTVSIDVYRASKRGDLDNYAKQLLDALQSHVYVDDGQIVELHMRRFDDKTHPRVEVRIEGGA